MMMTFPLPVALFWDLLPIDALVWSAPESVETGITGGGAVLSAELAPQLWRANVTLGRCKPDETARIETLLSVLRKPGRAFLAYDHRRPFPQLDPRGAVISGASVTVASAPSLRQIALAGLPARYPLSWGDYLSFSYDGGRRALHRVAEPVVAAVDGATAAFEVTPPLDGIPMTGTAVSLSRPSCAMQIVPNSISEGSSKHGWSEGTVFRTVQTLGVL